MENNFIGAFLLFIFCFIEVGCFFYFISSVEKRFKQPWLNFLIVLSFSFILFLITKSNVRYIYDYSYMCVYYFVILCFLFLITKTTVRESLYYLLIIIVCTRFVKHIIGHISISNYNQNYLVEGDNWYFRILYSAFILFLYYGIFAKIKKRIFNGNSIYLTNLQIVWMIASIIPMMYISDLVSIVMRNTASSNPNWAIYLSPLINEAICGVCGLIIIIGNVKILTLYVKESERINMERILEGRHQHYIIKKQATDTINQKYHDLKNHFVYMKKIKNPEKYHDYIDHLQNEIKAYESIQETGNETLNIILSEKCFQCQNKNIKFNFLVNGTSFDFMRPVDITTIFGNALDNAIESVENLDEPNKREIIVKSSEDKNWIIVRFENYFCHELNGELNQLKTTKDEHLHHGFGLKSIQYIVNKYKGNMTTTINDNKFILNILFENK